MEAVAVVILLLMLFFLLILPAFVSKWRNHRNGTAIVVLNFVPVLFIFIFWGKIGLMIFAVCWFVALIWACTNSSQVVQS